MFSCLHFCLKSLQAEEKILFSLCSKQACGSGNGVGCRGVGVQGRQGAGVPLCRGVGVLSSAPVTGRAWPVAVAVFPAAGTPGLPGEPADWYIDFLRLLF